MTKEEAIKGLKVLRRDFSGYKPNEEMFDMAIQALEQEQQRQEDIYKCQYCFGEVHKNYTYCPFCGERIEALDQVCGNDCDTCKHGEETDGMNCYECVKGMRDNYEPTAEYSSDVISREEVKKQTTKKNSIWNTITDSSGRGLDEILDSIPSAQPERKTDGDTISRQETLKGYQSVCEGIACHECRAIDADGTCRLESFINNLPSAQPFTTEQIQTMQELEAAQIEKAFELGKADRPKWIPCSKRLPEEGDVVLICSKIGVIDFGKRKGDKWVWLAEALWDYWQETEDLIAWMPLPEAYREDGEKE